ncbi:MAG: hypothetical protein QXL94_02225 [Candidatus Parvarchaeum sp.]
MESLLEDYKVVKRIQKVEELASSFLKVAMNRHKSEGAQKFRDNMEREALEEIIKEVEVLKDIMKEVK